MKPRRFASGRGKRAAALLLLLPLLLVLCLFLTSFLILLLQGSSEPLEAAAAEEEKAAAGGAGGKTAEEGKTAAGGAGRRAAEAQAEVEEAPLPPRNTKVAFLFIARNRLPLDLVWDAFFRGDKEGRFSVYVHSRPGFVLTRATTRSQFFYNRQVNNSVQVDWGESSMIVAERVLLSHALKDPLNERFVFVSDSCVPLYNFNYTYDYIMSSSTSFVDRYKCLNTVLYFLRLSFINFNGNSFWHFFSSQFDLFLLYLDPVDEIDSKLKACSSTVCFFFVILAYTIVKLCYAIHSFADTKAGRYNPRMDPIIPVENWRKGSQWAVLIRKHAEVVVNDEVVLPEFQKHCRRRPLPEFWRDWDRPIPAEAWKAHNCIPDEHYVQTLLAQSGLEEELTRRSVTHSAWDLSSSKDRERRGWHPVTYKVSDATPALIKSIKDIDNIYYETEYRKEWCTSNEKPAPCFLFARKFTRGAGLKLLDSVSSSPFFLLSFIVYIRCTH
ncbi:hypothetical protein PR202_ga11412 [Eleusine coracana subsp. coracana]|uniref:Core-2/I-branching beta-1,6-N-acetylglucosaminyltransferase family protein n=1 Tax=Eleusine coracana subsp. coracana TaxID=191504 RepID=A0AAV5C9I8_ELECO|nr:hypothetical protein PR202_ga11412 [Eleusine coracana subsp. coracana]